MKVRPYVGPDGNEPDAFGLLNGRVGRDPDGPGRPARTLRAALAYRDAAIDALPVDPDLDDEIDRALREARGPRVLRPIKLTLPAALLALAVLSGCSMSTLERHTVAAGLLHEASAQSARVIEAAAQRDADDAIRPCTEQGAPTPTCESVLDTRMQRWRRVAAAQSLYAASVDAYVSGVLVAAAEEDPDWGDALRLLGEALSVYRQVVALCAEYGVELPALTRVVSLIGGDL